MRDDTMTWPETAKPVFSVAGPSRRGRSDHWATGLCRGVPGVGGVAACQPFSMTEAAKRSAGSQIGKRRPPGAMSVEPGNGSLPGSVYAHDPQESAGEAFRLHATRHRFAAPLSGQGTRLGVVP